MSAKKSSGFNLGERLTQSLTKEQISALLNVLFLARNQSQDVVLLAKLDPDISRTVRKVLQANPPEKKAAIFSEQRLLEEWQKLWNEWDLCVYEVGDELGKYAVQENSWDAPYFDGSLLADDLEEIATRMLPWINQVFASVKNPDLFRCTMTDIDSAIDSYPDWMGARNYDASEFAEKTTECILKWAWLEHQDKPKPGIHFLKQVRELETLSNMIKLNTDTCISFLAMLPDDAGQEIYQEMTSGKSKEWAGDEINQTHSLWHAIHHQYEKKYNPDGYLQSCSQHLAKNWRYAVPLVKNELAKQKYHEAENILIKTFFAYLQLQDNEKWLPETSLLEKTNRRFYRSAEDRQDICHLLDLWAVISEHLREKSRFSAAKLQSEIFRAPEDWNAIIEKFKQLRNPQLPELDRLFQHWQALMVEGSIHLDSHESVPADTWIQWLISAEVNDSGDKNWFQDKLTNWLKTLKETRKTFIKQESLLSRLIKDLPNISTIKAKYPNFFATVLPGDHSQNALQTSRREKLKKWLNADSILPHVMDVWKKHLYKLIPNPEVSHHSQYCGHVQWLIALKELNPTACSQILQEWHTTHRSRRNLWKELQKNHLLD